MQVPSTDWVVWGFPKDPFHPQCNSQQWKLHLVTRNGQLGFHIPHYLETSLGLPSYILGSSYCTRFPYHPSDLAVSHCIPFLNPSLFPTSPPSPPDPPIPIPHSHPQYTHKIYFPLPGQSCVSPDTQSMFLWIYGLQLGYHLLNS